MGPGGGRFGRLGHLVVFALEACVGAGSFRGPLGIFRFPPMLPLFLLFFFLIVKNNNKRERENRRERKGERAAIHSRTLRIVGGVCVHEAPPPSGNRGDLEGEGAGPHTTQYFEKFRSTCDHL